MLLIRRCTSVRTVRWHLKLIMRTVCVCVCVCVCVFVVVVVVVVIVLPI